MFFSLQVNIAMDHLDYGFFGSDGENIISDCFDAVLVQNVNNGWSMPQQFRQWVEDSVSDGFQWPIGYSNSFFGNAIV